MSVHVVVAGACGVHDDALTVSGVHVPAAIVSAVHVAVDGVMICQRGVLRICAGNEFNPATSGADAVLLGVTVLA